MTYPLQHSEILGRRVRIGDWQDQARSSWDKILEAIDRHDPVAASDLAEYSVDECKISYDIQGQWQADLRKFLLERGCSTEELAAAEADILDKIKEPDGRAHDRPTSWGLFLELTQKLRDKVMSEAWDDAREAVAHQRERWRIEHDRDADWTYGLMSECVSRFGEEVVPEMFEAIAGPLFDWRYKKFDVSDIDWDSEGLPTLLLISLEAMRTHLSTSARDGAPLELLEHEDRWELRFDPCGSGGRAMRGDVLEDTPSRMEPPYGWKVIEGAYDWTDQKAGVCIYCNHCQVLMEHKSMDRFGYPVRVVEPPLYPKRDGVRVDEHGADRQRCSWTMYKDPTQVPEEIYRRSGRTKPDSFGSSREGIGEAAPADEAELPFMGKG